MNPENLTEYEKVEIKDFNSDEIYYTGEFESKINILYSDYLEDNNVFLNNRNRYTCTIKDHFLYRYEIIDSLGGGSYGNVIKVKDHKDDTLKAVKVFKKFDFFDEFKNNKLFLDELNILNILKERLKPNDYSNDSIYFTNYIDTFNFRAHNFIVFNLYGKNLYKDRYKIYSSTIDQKLIIIKDIVNALIYFSDGERKIINADLKPENILFKNNDAKNFNIVICDFGLSLILEPKEKKKMYSSKLIQTKWYRAPEIYFKIPFNEKIDIWSLGCIIYEIIEDKPLFKVKKDYDLIIVHHSVLGLPFKDFISSDLNIYKKYDNYKPYKINIETKKYYPGRGSIVLDKFFELNLDNYENKISYHLVRLIYLCLDYNQDTRISAENCLKFINKYCK